MAKPAAERLLDQIQVALAERVERWSAAIDVIVAPGLDRWSPERTEAEQVMALFERFLLGDIGGDELLQTIHGALPESVWTAIEACAAGVSADEWAPLAARLLASPEVKRERRALRHLWSPRRALAARRIGMLEANEMRYPLRKAMMRGPERVTLQAALALSRLRDLPAVEWLLEHPRATAGRTRRQLVDLLVAFGPGAVPALRAALAGEKKGAPIHAAAIEALGAHADADSVRPLLAQLRQGALEARAASARALGRIGSPDAAPALIQALDDEAWQVRAQAARALGWMPGPANVAPLGGRVNDVSWWVRRHSAYALGRHGEAGRQALEAIERAEEDLFAAQIAREVLQALDWDEDVPGSFDRVA